ncbi:hypothetical protein WN982_25435 [Paraburkholderia sp. IMGN_8]|uniref:hypothetical protein n=1 Tax=Paraburkholderia sp. IMGN_8 TaxID=3136564 RepID=UPI003101934F
MRLAATASGCTAGWLNRALWSVVDSASIEVNRRARRAKTDRLDSDKLMSVLIRYLTGERRVWAMARIPTPEQEDDRRLHRELERLRQERTAHTNRMRSLLVLPNLRVRYVGDRIWTHWWARQRELLAPGLRAEIDRECERLALVRQQIRLLEAQQDQQVRSGAHPGMALLAQLAGIGTGSARCNSDESMRYGVRHVGALRNFASLGRHLPRTAPPVAYRRSAPPLP